MENKESPRVRILFVLIDGIAELDVAEFNNKTALAYAHIPHMDSIARYGVCGVHDPVQSGLACGSDAAHLNILGYNPFEYYNGRGAFETLGAGIDMAQDEIAFKCNFSLINDETEIVEKRRVDRHFDWGVPLCDAIDGIAVPGFPSHRITCNYATEHRCGLKISGPGLSSKLEATDPLKDNKPL